MDADETAEADLLAWRRELADISDSEEYRRLGRKALWFSVLAGLALEPLTGRGYMRAAAAAHDKQQQMRLAAIYRAFPQ